MRDALSLLDQVLAFGGGRAMEAEVRTLLGTLDRKHVQGILTALADKDGAALMQQAAHLDERAPDYHQALGELSGAIQRMALLQALPDLPPGDDEDEDRLLAELAAKFTAEDLQLLYQIAINSRRDLDYAPDARAGFEMALLRMLAFRPQGVPPATAAGSGGTGAARATTAARSAGVPSRTAASARGARKSGWDAIVAALGLQGTAKHFAANCVMLERKAGLVRLRLDPAGDSFRRPQIESRLARGAVAALRRGDPSRDRAGRGAGRDPDAGQARCDRGRRPPARRRAIDRQRSRRARHA